MLYSNTVSTDFGTAIQHWKAGKC